MTEETMTAAEETALVAEGDSEKLDIDLDVSDAGPCQKHLKVTVPQKEVSRYFDREFGELVRSANVPGFRQGKTPRKLIERKFRKDVAGQVKTGLLVQSLQQVLESDELHWLQEPDIDPGSIEMPEDGDLVYEFDIEVAPDFEVPSYAGLKIKRPVKDFADADVDAEVDDFRRRYATTEEKPDGAAVEMGDQVVVDGRMMAGDEVVREFDALGILVEKELLFKDGRIADFGKRISGKKVGDSVELDVKVSEQVNNEKLAGRTIKAEMVVNEIKAVKTPALDAEFLGRVGVSDEGELRDLIRAGMEQQLQYAQTNAAREQLSQQLVSATDMQLPPDMLKRQTQKTLRRRLMELQQAGFGEEELRARFNTLSNNAREETSKSLQLQFVLQKIADKEDIEVEQKDLEQEVFRIAQQSHESPRKVRARIERENLWESIALQVLERRTMDRILESAEYEDVPYQDDEDFTSAAVDESAVPDDPEPASEPAESDDSA